MVLGEKLDYRELTLDFRLDYDVGACERICELPCDADVADARSHGNWHGDIADMVEPRGRAGSKIINIGDFLLHDV